MMRSGNYTNLFSLSGKIAFVTGGAGILGKQFCAGLADFGANVAVVDIEKEKAEIVANNLVDIYKIDAIGVECDISNQDSILNAIDIV